MMRYRLRTLLIVLALGPPVAAWLVNVHRHVQERRPYISRFNDHQFPLRRAGLVPQDKHSDVSWIRHLMGDAAEPTLLYQSSADRSGEQFKRVRQLFPEATIWGWPHDNHPLPSGVNRLPPNILIII
jgi:hypothetical protein